MPRTTDRVRYKICTPLQTVKLEERPGSSLRDPSGTLIQIPADAVLEVEAQWRIPGSSMCCGRAELFRSSMRTCRKRQAF